VSCFPTQTVFQIKRLVINAISIINLKIGLEVSKISGKLPKNEGGVRGNGKKKMFLIGGC